MNKDFENHDEHGKLVKFVDSRFYMLPEKPDTYFPGVTTILNVIDKGDQYKHWLQSNGFNADVLARQAMDQGSHVHEAIQDFLNGKEIRWATEEVKFYTRHEWEMISRFIDFYTAFKPQTVVVERVLVSEKLGYGTQLDYVCKLNGELIYIDHKTGSVYDSANMQIAASIKLWNECLPDKITKGAVLHLESAHRGRDSKGKSIQGKGWKLIEIENLEKEWEDFQHVQAIWKRKNPVIKPFNKVYPDRYSIESVTSIDLPDE
jgi:hypothetical protein